jgi:hypothetical protein
VMPGARDRRPIRCANKLSPVQSRWLRRTNQTRATGACFVTNLVRDKVLEAKARKS